MERLNLETYLNYQPTSTERHFEKRVIELGIYLQEAKYSRGRVTRENQEFIFQTALDVIDEIRNGRKTFSEGIYASYYGLFRIDPHENEYSIIKKVISSKKIQEEFIGFYLPNLNCKNFDDFSFELLTAEKNGFFEAKGTILSSSKETRDYTIDFFLPHAEGCERNWLPSDGKRKLKFISKIYPSRIHMIKHLMDYAIGLNKKNRQS